MNDISVSRINNARVELEDRLQGVHVVVKVLEDGGALAEDAVAAEHGVLLEQVKDDMVDTVARCVQHSQRRTLYRELLTVFQKVEGDAVWEDVAFRTRILPHLTVFCDKDQG